jgi:polyhydroxybutyrate depolymerase
MGDGAAVAQLEKPPSNASKDCREALATAGQPGINCRPEVAKTADTGSIHLPGFELSSALTTGATQKTTIDVDGTKRDVWLHLPANYDASKPVPLMLVFNGVGDGGSGMEKFTGMSKRADEQGFAVAYLDGSGIQHSYNNHEWPFDNSADDVKYTSKVIDTLEKDLSIDKSRVGLVGFSEGGSFAHLAASQLSDKVSSVGEVEGWMTGKESKTSSPVSELSIHGQDDRIVPFGGTEDMLKKTALKALGYLTPLGPLTDVVASVSHVLHGDSPLSFTPLEAAAVGLQELHNVYVESQIYTVDQYKKNDQISDKPYVDTQGNVTRTIYRNGDTGATVEQIALKHGQHAWAGSTDHRADIPLVGQPSNDINASDEIVNFFMTHPKVNK